MVLPLCATRTGFGNLGLCIGFGDWGFQGLGPQKLLVNPSRQIRIPGSSSDMSGVLMAVVGVANIFVTDM